MRGFVQLLSVILLVAPVARAVEPTFAELVAFCAENYFKEQIGPDATLADEVSFLNDHGVCVSLFDLMDPDVPVAKEDLARMIGQSVLLFSGEAVLEKEGIQRPKEVVSWVDYCVLNDVPLEDIWVRFTRAVEKRSFPEVDAFFANGL